MTILTVDGVSLEFGDSKILDGISFSVNEGDRLGIIGVNGVGKTSLFRVITGEYAPTAGSVYISKEKTVGLLEQNVIISDADGNKTVLEYMYSAFPELLSLEAEISTLEKQLAANTDPYINNEEIATLSERLHAANDRYIRNGGLEFRNRCRSSLLSLGFLPEHLELRVSSLSGGQHTRLSLSRLIAREPDILMLDEPTNHLDIDALIWLENFICNYKKTVMIISHDRYFLDRTTTKTLHLRYGRAKLYPGNYTKCKSLEEQDAASLEKKYKEQQRQIAKIRENIAFQRRCGMEHNFVTIRAKEKQIARMQLVELVPKEEKTVRINFEYEKSIAEEVLKIKNLTFGYGSRILLNNINLLVRNGERVIFLGENGCGKSTLIKIIMKKLMPDSGYCEFGYNIKAGYFDQENSFADTSATVYEEMRNAYPSKTDLELRSALALFLFDADDIDRKISELSGGEKARLTLSKLMLKKVNLLVMDEPTNHLDIGSREALEAALTAFGGTVIAVSHDRYFIDGIATRIIEIDANADGGIHDYPLSENEGAYTEYLRLKENKNNTSQSSAAQTSDGKLDYIRRKEEERIRRMDASKKTRAEKEIEKLESESESLKKELFESAASDYLRAAEIDRRMSEIDARLLELYEIVL